LPRLPLLEPPDLEDELEPLEMLFEPLLITGGEEDLMLLLLFLFGGV